ncbi:hypothetical protein [Natroniella sp. ANB-PHB2]|uniref:hypothetical protein n=1 Tax=Natroniella sp. ANB-PHB2 TaxID=3384444 RepID=UPI0038D4A27E
MKYKVLHTSKGKEPMETEEFIESMKGTELEAAFKLFWKRLIKARAESEGLEVSLGNLE